MKKRILSVLLIFVLVFSMVACSSESKKTKADEEEQEEEQEEKSSKKKKKDKDKKKETEQEPVEAALRQYLMEPGEVLYDETLVPSIEPYSVNSDFSNVVYDEEFRYLFDPSYEYFYEGNQKLIDIPIIINSTL